MDSKVKDRIKTKREKQCKTCGYVFMKNHMFRHKRLKGLNLKGERRCSVIRKDFTQIDLELELYKTKGLHHGIAGHFTVQ